MEAMIDRRFASWRHEASEFPRLSEEERALSILDMGRDVEQLVRARPDGREMLRRQEPKSPRAAAWWLELVRRGRESSGHSFTTNPLDSFAPPATMAGP